MVPHLISTLLSLLPLLLPLLIPLPIPTSSQEYTHCGSDKLNVTPSYIYTPPRPAVHLSSNTTLKYNLKDESHDTIRVRFHPIMPEPETDDDLEMYRAFTEELLLSAGHYLRRTFRVPRILRSENDRLIFDYFCSKSAFTGERWYCFEFHPPKCVGRPVPVDHIRPFFHCALEDQHDCAYTEGGGGANQTDLLLYVSWTPCDAVAFAASCLMHNGRSKAGFFNMCQGPMNMIRDGRRSLVIQSMIHEIFHIMGFVQGSFPHYLDDEGNNRNWVNGTKVQGVWEKIPKENYDQYRMKTEYSVDYMREVSNCSTARGVSLQTHPTHVGSHLDDMLHREDVMTPAITDYSDVTNASLSVLRDSGWYAINFETAYKPMFGHHSTLADGCAFAERECFDSEGNNVSPTLFCSSARPTCPHYLDAVKSCSGPEGCRLFGFWTKGYNGETLSCSNQDNNNYFYAHTGAYFSRESRCMESSLSSERETGMTPMCYPTTCIPATDDEFANEWDHVILQVYNDFTGVTTDVVCKNGEEGVTKEVEGFYGAITCPIVNRACWNKPCQNRSTPKYQMCQCSVSHFGLYCQHYRSVENIAKYISDLHYGDLQHVVLIVGRSYELPAYVSGDVQKFEAVNDLPKGLSVSPLGSIVGVPTEASGCHAYTIAAKGKEADDQSRVVVYIQVMSEIPYGGVKRFSTCDKLLLEFQPNVSKRTLTDEEEVEYMAGIYEKWSDVYHDPYGSYASFIVVEDPHYVTRPFIPIKPTTTSTASPSTGAVGGGGQLLGLPIALWGAIAAAVVVVAAFVSGFVGARYVRHKRLMSQSESGDLEMSSNS